jgi:hypothetical protein
VSRAPASQLHLRHWYDSCLPPIVFHRSALTLTLTLGFVGRSFVNEFRRESSSSRRARPVDSGNLAI